MNFVKFGPWHYNSGMIDDLHTLLQKAASKILRPLIRVMLRNGIACGSFEAMVRKAYVDEAFELARSQGKVTVSAVSAQTGLSRKEVKRLQDIESTSRAGNSQKYNRAVRVISGWMNDSRFISDEGVALTLELDGTENSFTALIKDYSGDIPTRAMLDLLKNSGCVEQLNGKVSLISHAYVPGNDPADIIDILGSDSHELMSSIIHNMSCKKSQRRFQRKVSTKRLAAAELDAFHKYSSRRSQALLEDLDNWLTQHEASPDQMSEYVSLGIYFYHSNSDEQEQESSV